MNILTIVSVDWVHNHLCRFLHFAKQCMPDNNYYVVLTCKPGVDINNIRVLAQKLKPHVTDIKLVQESDVGEGRLLFYDILRADLLQLFNLSEGLYVDVDVDILESLNGVPEMDRLANIIWSPDIMPMGHIGVALQQYHLPSNPPYAAIGFMYLRKSYSNELRQLLEDNIVDRRSIAPGSAAWNIIIKREPKTFMIPQHYHITWWGGVSILSAKSIHFSGAWSKLFRDNINYVLHNTGRSILITKEQMKYNITL